MLNGIATFGGLTFDRSGRNLRLRFALFDYDRYSDSWADTNVFLETPFFDVGEGAPAALTITQASVTCQNLSVP